METNDRSTKPDKPSQSASKWDERQMVSFGK
jgi:hypothetical protein